MKVLGINEISEYKSPTALSIGVFDGVHIGHRSLLAILRSRAEKFDAKSVVLTFDRHPAELLAPEKAPLRINTLDQKLSLLYEAGVDDVIVVKFDHDFADIPCDEFIDNIIADKLKAAVVVVGTNFRFGRKRCGDVDVLEMLGTAKGVKVISVEPTVVNGAPVSSTRVRNALARGEVDAAEAFLGRPFTMLGRVVKGFGIGRELGYPTANVDVAERQIVPLDGVYAVRTTADGRVWTGVCSIGNRPTLGGTERAIEVMIDGFSGDLYDAGIGVAFVKRLREQIKFESVDQLKEQIGKDVESARQFGVL